MTSTASTVESGQDGVLHPVASSCAMEQLLSVVPTLPSEQFDITASPDALPSRQLGLNRLGQVFRTALPLVLADTTCLLLLHISSMFMVSTIVDITIPMQSAQIVWLCCGYSVFGIAFEVFPGTGVNPVRVLRNQLATVFATGTTLLAFCTLAGEVSFALFSTIALTLLGSFLSLPFIRSITRHWCVRLDWWGERAIVVGMSKKAMTVFRFQLDNAHLGLRPIGVVSENASDYWAQNESADGVRFLGRTCDLLEIARSENCHWVIVVPDSENEAQRRRTLSVCSLIPNLVLAECSMPAPNLWGTGFDVAGLNGILIRDSLLRPFLRAAKRIVDVVGSATLLLLTCPLWIVVSLALYFSSPGRVLFHGERIGRGGKTFRQLKFRTMVHDSNRALKVHLQNNPAARDEWERTHKLRNDPRIIPGIGHFLRRWSLDELPQLWNVFRGDMSLVGPRPIVQDEIERFGTAFVLYARMRPGLTGLWQVSGRNRTTYEARIHLIVYYVRNWSLWLDYHILLRTLRAVVTGEGSC